MIILLFIYLVPNTKSFQYTPVTLPVTCNGSHFHIIGISRGLLDTEHIPLCCPAQEYYHMGHGIKPDADVSRQQLIPGYRRTAAQKCTGTLGPQPFPVTDQYTQLIQPEQSSPFKSLPSSSGTVSEPKPFPV